MRFIPTVLGRPYIQYGGFFLAGVGLELFMNFFHIGEANIYRSILKNISQEEAERRFLVEKELYETINSEQTSNKNLETGGDVGT